ncbi:DUF1294 domain-containing protein [Paenibacillus abyssi]|uniref:DUF1294 domain-containing protein n=1 Tax=Paenibacillus abyssi TaxID=1340531 RepID=A0A917CFC7_9BACL|nr:DUF1294 domain-containing protein [Paenibacillus abyssi]GGF86770.1 hypothetical protein GCM10010916_00110 [Paenibacillus abyssi]
MIEMAFYLLLINIVSFSMMRYDKRQAVKHGRRVPEKQLFVIAAIGGALGAWLGMRIWRHKTKHNSFVYGIPALFILNIAALWFIYFL